MGWYQVSLGLLVGSIATLCVFVGWDYYHGSEKAMIPLNLLRRRIIYSSCLSTTFQMGTALVVTFYLPIWFQTIKDATPIFSGVYFLGTVIPACIFPILAGVFVNRFGYPIIPMAIGNALSAIGTGLLGTLSVDSSVSSTIEYQILCGIARGTIMHMPIIAVQYSIMSTDSSQLATGTAMLTFTQFFGGAIFIAFAQKTFTNSLGPALKKYGVELSSSIVIETGATALRGAVSDSQLEGVHKILSCPGERALHLMKLL